MQRVMIIGQPGAGKSTLAKIVGETAHLPVIHIDLIHWKSGWVERTGPEKDALIAAEIAKPRWVFEGGRSSTWDERLARADTLIWLDLPLGLRLFRVVARTLKHHGRSRSDLPDGCNEYFHPEFYSYIWRTRNTVRARSQRLYDSVPDHKSRHHLRTRREVEAFVQGLRKAARTGNLGISHH